MLIRRQAVAPLVSAALLLGCNAMTSSAANSGDAGREMTAEEAETFQGSVKLWESCIEGTVNSRRSGIGY